MAVHPFHPTNPLFGNDYAFAFLSPYMQAVGLAARAVGGAAVDTLIAAGVVNLVLLVAALHAFVATWLRRPAASFYALLFMLFLWGREPWLYSGFFHLRCLSYVMPYPSTFTAALALGTLAAFTRLADAPRRWIPLVFVVATLVWTIHPITGLFLWVGFGVWSFSAPRSWGHWAALALVAAGSFGLAMAWPLVPMRELWFGQLARVHEGNDLMYADPLPRIAPALLGVPWLLLRLRRNWRDPLALFAAGLAALVVYGGVSHAWSYGRLISHLVLLLQVALADAVVSAETLVGRRSGWARHLLAPAACVALVAASWPAVQGIVAECRQPGDRHWLDFLQTRVGRDDVVLTDLETCWYVAAFHGKVVAYQMNIPFVPDYLERQDAVGRFFAEDATDEERRRIVERYDVRYVLLPKGHFDDWAQRLQALERLGTPVFSSPDYELVRVGEAAAPRFPS